MPDYIYIVVSIPPTISYELFRIEPKFRLRYPRGDFWSSGEYFRSVGDVDLDTTRKYVQFTYFVRNLLNFVQ